MLRDKRESARDLHAGGSTADDGERQPRGPRLRVGRPLGLLEGAVDPVAQLDGVGQRLEPARDVPPLVVAEVRGLATAGDDQAVVVESIAAVQHDLLALGVDVGDLAHQYRGVAGAAQRLADGRCAFPGGSGAPPATW